MGKYNMEELEIKFNMVKPSGEDFTDDEIDQFNNEFIDLVEKFGYFVAGSIGPYNDNEDECTDDDYNEDEEIFSMGEEDMDFPNIDPHLKGPWEDELNNPLNG